MLRLLITPKWLALTVILVMLVVTFVWLGLWQWSRAITTTRPSSTQPSTKVAEEYLPLREVHVRGDPVATGADGQPVVVRGTYVLAQELLVPGRIQEGKEGFWVLTPLRLTDDEVIPVVRGWVADPTEVTPAPQSPVTIEGVLKASEADSLRDSAPTALADNEIAIVSSPELLSRWSGELWQGYVLLQTQQPASDLVPVAPDEELPRNVSWQSLTYAVQWWLFAAFTIFFYSRMFSLDYRVKVNAVTTRKGPA